MERLEGEVAEQKQALLEAHQEGTRQREEVLRLEVDLGRSREAQDSLQLQVPDTHTTSTKPLHIFSLQHTKPGWNWCKVYYSFAHNGLAIQYPKGG